jgi:8-oxo-dGTP diphosphatase
VRARARVVVVEDGRLALIRRRRDGRLYHLFPGGGVEAGETPEQAAVREAWEELGVRVELGPLLHEEVLGDERFLYFAGRIVGGEFGTGAWPDLDDAAEPEKGGSHEPVWVPLGELRNTAIGLDVRPVALVERLVSSSPS